MGPKKKEYTQSMKLNDKSNCQTEASLFINQNKNFISLREKNFNEQTCESLLHTNLQELSNGSIISHPTNNQIFINKALKCKNSLGLKNAKKLHSGPLEKIRINLFGNRIKINESYLSYLLRLHARNLSNTKDFHKSVFKKNWIIIISWSIIDCSAVRQKSIQSIFRSQIEKLKKLSYRYHELLPGKETKNINFSRNQKQNSSRKKTGYFSSKQVSFHARTPTLLIKSNPKISILLRKKAISLPEDYREKFLLNENNFKIKRNHTNNSRFAEYFESKSKLRKKWELNFRTLHSWIYYSKRSLVEVSIKKHETKELENKGNLMYCHKTTKDLQIYPKLLISPKHSPFSESNELIKCESAKLNREAIKQKREFKITEIQQNLSKSKKKILNIFSMKAKRSDKLHLSDRDRMRIGLHLKVESSKSNNKIFVLHNLFQSRAQHNVF